MVKKKLLTSADRKAMNKIIKKGMDLVQKSETEEWRSEVLLDRARRHFMQSAKAINVRVPGSGERIMQLIKEIEQIEKEEERDKRILDAIKKQIPGYLNSIR